MNGSMVEEQARKQVLTTTKILAIKMKTFLEMKGPTFHAHLSEKVISDITTEIEKGLDVLLASSGEDFSLYLEDFNGILETYDDAFAVIAKFINR